MVGLVWVSLLILFFLFVFFCFSFLQQLNHLLGSKMFLRTWLVVSRVNLFYNICVWATSVFSCAVCVVCMCVSV